MNAHFNSQMAQMIHQEHEAYTRQRQLKNAAKNTAGWTLGLRKKGTQRASRPVQYHSSDVPAVSHILALGLIVLLPVLISLP